MKKLIAGLAIAFAAFGIVGCADGTAPGDTLVSVPKAVAVNAHYVDLPDGRKVLCVYEGNANDGRSGGPSCDWGNAK